MTDDFELPPDPVYLAFISAAPQRVWDAQTRSRFTGRLFSFGRTRKFVEAGKQGWAAILASLRSPLETAEPPIIKLRAPQ